MRGPGNVLDQKIFLRQNPGFWLNRRVLITGHTGFLGCWLAARLSGLGADLTGLARAPASTAGLFHLAGLSGLVKNRILDLRDRARVEQTMIAEAPEIVFHLAVRKAAGDALKRPLDSFDTNAIGTLNLLNAVRRTPEVKAVIVVTDDSVRRVGGAGPAAASLACAEIVVESYRATYLQPEDGIGLATIRPCAVIGGGDVAGDNVLSGLLRHQAIGGAPSSPAGPELCRPFLHVLDAIEACRALAEGLSQDPERCGRVWPIGPLDPAACLAAIAELAGSTPRAGADLGAAPGLDREAMAAALGWRPVLDARAAIAWTIEGDRRLAREAHAGFLLEQIDRLTTRRSTATPTVAPAGGASRLSPAANAKASDVFLSA